MIQIVQGWLISHAHLMIIDFHTEIQRQPDDENLACRIARKCQSILIWVTLAHVFVCEKSKSNTISRPISIRMQGSSNRLTPDEYILNQHALLIFENLQNRKPHSISHPHTHPTPTNGKFSVSQIGYTQKCLFDLRPSFLPSPRNTRLQTTNRWLLSSQQLISCSEP